MRQSAVFTVPVGTPEERVLDPYVWGAYALKWLKEMEKEGQVLNSEIGCAPAPHQNRSADPRVLTGERREYRLWADFKGTPRYLKIEVDSENAIQDALDYYGDNASIV